MTTVTESQSFSRMLPLLGEVGPGALSIAVDPFALSLNENPFPPLPAVRSALIDSVEAVNRYPEFLPERLRSLIAKRVGVFDEQVVLGAGATGVMLQVLQAVTEPGDRIVMSDPTFEGHEIVSRMTRLMPVSVPLDQRGYYDLNEMADAASDARVAVICRPHNPTGTVEPLAAVEQFLARVPRETVVVIDEAYVEFVPPQYQLDSVALVRRFPNVLILRSFSKAYGLAGLRIGYAFGSTELVARPWGMQLPFGMSSICFAAVKASYAAERQLRDRVEEITAERCNLLAGLRDIGIYSTDAQANFVYLPGADGPWSEVLADTEVRVKHYSDGGVRITIGASSSTDAVLAALRSKL